MLPKLTSDLGAGISAILDGETPEFTWDESNATLGVVIASNGYPENVIKGARVPEIEMPTRIRTSTTPVSPPERAR